MSVPAEYNSKNKHQVFICIAETRILPHQKRSPYISNYLPMTIIQPRILIPILQNDSPIAAKTPARKPHIPLYPPLVSLLFLSKSTPTPTNT